MLKNLNKILIIPVLLSMICTDKNEILDYRNNWQNILKLDLFVIRYNKAIILDTLNSNFVFEIEYTGSDKLFMLNKNIITNNIEIVEVVTFNNDNEVQFENKKMLQTMLNKYIGMNMEYFFYSVNDSDFIMIKPYEKYIIKDNWADIVKMLGRGEFIIKYNFLAENSEKYRYDVYHNQCFFSNDTLPVIHYPKVKYVTFDGEIIFDSLNVKVE